MSAFWGKADIQQLGRDFRFLTHNGHGTNAKRHDVRYAAAIGGKAEVTRTSSLWRE